MTHLVSKIALSLLEKCEELMALATASTLDVITDHVRLFGFNFALRLTLTKQE